MEARLTNWKTTIPNLFAAPEVLGRPTVVGVLAHDHRGFLAGNQIVSSAIVKIEGRRLTTQSGSVYILVGQPHPAWIEQMNQQGSEIDLDDPLKWWRGK